MKSDPIVVDAVEFLDKVVEAKGGIKRDGQVELTEYIASALGGGETHLLSQAPTGVGKSLAYICAAAAYIKNTPASARLPIIIVTATKALQEQLIDHDLPMAHDVLDTKVKFKSTLLKGRSNYLCAAKLSELKEDTQLTFAVDNATAGIAAGEEVKQLTKWSETTETGDRSDYPGAVADASWTQVSISAGACPGRNSCSFADVCWSEHAREAAERSDLVVANAALYAASIASGGGGLPEHQIVIIDEAHVFDATITDAFTSTLSPAGIRNLASGSKRFGASAEMIGAADGAAEILQTQCESYDIGFDGVIVDVTADFGDALAAVEESVGAILSKVGAHQKENRTSPAIEQYIAALNAMHSSVTTIRSASDAYATWVQENSAGNAELVAAPIEVGNICQEKVWSEHLVVAMSATLKVAGTFESFVSKTGLNPDLNSWVEIEVKSPFNYREKALLYVAKHLPDPRNENFTEELDEELFRLIVAAKGRALCLFTSSAGYRRAAHSLEARLTKHNISVWAQGEASRTELVQRLVDATPKAGVALFATQSFWTGVDVAGSALSLVTIDKLPFARPSDPLNQAKRERIEKTGANAFFAVDVPRASVLLTQGTGRLIRSTTDAGVIAILDKRLATAGYRKELLASLPPYKRTVSFDEVSKFLDDKCSE